MKTALPRPPRTITIRSYAALLPFLTGFRDGNFNLLFLIGAPGLGKSRQARAALGDREALLIEGHATPLKIYEQLFRHMANRWYSTTKTVATATR